MTRKIRHPTKPWKCSITCDMISIVFLRKRSRKIDDNFYCLHFFFLFFKDQQQKIVFFNIYFQYMTPPGEFQVTELPRQVTGVYKNKKYQAKDISNIDATET